MEPLAASTRTPGGLAKGATKARDYPAPLGFTQQVHERYGIVWLHKHTTLRSDVGRDVLRHTGRKNDPRCLRAKGLDKFCDGPAIVTICQMHIQHDRVGCLIAQGCKRCIGGRADPHIRDTCVFKRLFDREPEHRIVLYDENALR